MSFVFLALAGAQAAYDAWISESDDLSRSRQIFDDLDGDLVYYFDRCYIGALCITRLTEADGSEECRSGIVYTIIDDPSLDEFEVQVCTPSEPRNNKKFWSLRWSLFQGNLLIITFETARTRLGIDVCSNVFEKNCANFFFFVQLDNFIGQLDKHLNVHKREARDRASMNGRRGQARRSGGRGGRRGGRRRGRGRGRGGRGRGRGRDRDGNGNSSSASRALRRSARLNANDDNDNENSVANAPSGEIEAMSPQQTLSEVVRSEVLLKIFGRIFF